MTSISSEQDDSGVTKVRLWTSQIKEEATAGASGQRPHSPYVKPNQAALICQDPALMSLLNTADSAPLDHHLSFLLTGSPVRGCDSLKRKVGTKDSSYQ